MDTGLSHLTALSETAFAEALGGVYEHSPWVAARAAGARPFETLDTLHAAMMTMVAAASEAEQLALIRAHPDLAGRAALRGELTAHSQAEQQGAGLDRLEPEEYARFHALNDAYKERFGFPFVLAVKGHDKRSILAALQARLSNDRDAERETALQEIHKIARFRLEALLE
jgi:2-oxo-4-hydroxy-4-carboxy-5-ureidoimidazoline decarboxylase